MPGQQIDPKDKISFADSHNLAMNVATVYAWGVFPFLLAGGGTESPGWAGLIVFVLLGVMAGESPAWKVYFLAWIIALIIYRLRLDRRQMSNHWGYPWVFVTLQQRLGFRVDPGVGNVMNIILCFVVGTFLMGYDESLGMAIRFESVALTLLGASHEMLERRQRIALHNARVKAEIMQEMARRGRS